MTPADAPDETTSGIGDARKALAESRRSNLKVDTLIADASHALEQIKRERENNHFADKFRAIIRGMS